MAKQLHRDLVNRFNNLENDRTTVQQIWQSIERFITPYRGRFFFDQKSEHTIDWFNQRHIYDSTAVMAHRNLANSIHGSLTSPTIKWFDLRFRDTKLNDSKPATQWIQDAAETVHYSLQDSNFDLEINKAYQDVCGFGTAFLSLEKNPGRDWNGLHFTSVPLKESYFETDYRGQPVYYYRLVEMTPVEIVSRWGDDTPEDMRRRANDGDDEKCEVLCIVYPRNNRVMRWGETAAPSRRPWATCYVLRNNAEQLGKDDGFYEFPTFVGRWAETNSSIWGNSPAMDALADVLTLNQMVKQTIRARAKMIDPPLMAEERALVTDLQLDPATLSTVRNVNGIGPIPGPDNLSLATQNDEINRLQSAVRNYFLTDRIDFPDLQPQPMTATEAQIRYERMQRHLGATLAHLRNDLLNPIVERAFMMLIREGQIPAPPESVVARGGQYDIEYLGSLTAAQKSEQVTSIERTIAAAGNLAAVSVEALDAVDIPKAVREIGRSLNAPANILRSEDEVAKVREQRNQMIAEQASREARMSEAETETAEQEAMNANQS